MRELDDRDCAFPLLERPVSDHSFASPLNMPTDHCKSGRLAEKTPGDLFAGGWKVAHHVVFVVVVVAAAAAAVAVVVVVVVVVHIVVVVVVVATVCVRVNSEK